MLMAGRINRVLNGKFANFLIKIDRGNRRKNKLHYDAGASQGLRVVKTMTLVVYDSVSKS